MYSLLILLVLVIMMIITLCLSIMYYGWLCTDLYLNNYYENKKQFVSDLIPFSRFFKIIKKNFEKLK